MKFRTYQVRQFGGRIPEFKYKEDKVYSVICHVMKENKTSIYEHKVYKDLSYFEAKKIADLFESNKMLPNLCEWEELDVI